jgi:hypothetical protein
VLRPGNVTAAARAVGILRRLMALIRGSFFKARIRVRLDGGFANPKRSIRGFEMPISVILLKTLGYIANTTK